MKKRLGATSKPKRPNASAAVVAIYKLECGDRSELAAILRKGALAPDDQPFLADVIERVKITPPRQRGRPRSKYLTDASLQAKLVARYEAAHRRHERLKKASTIKRMTGDLTPHELALDDVARLYDLKAADIAKVVTANRRKKI